MIYNGKTDFNKIVAKLGIDETLTKGRPKPKHFNHINNYIAHVKYINYMADILYLPEDKNGFKFCLVVVDLASHLFDIEPTKNLEAKTILAAFQKMFKRKYIKMPKSCVRTDGGAEFKGVFDEFLKKNDVKHFVTLADRHTQMSMCESLNRSLGRLFNGYMNKIELETKKEYKNWTDVVPEIRKELNEYREVILPKNPDDEPIPTWNLPPDAYPKFRVGDLVHHKLEVPENALGHKQPTKSFRMGDFRYSSIPKKITKVIYMLDDPFFRYYVEGIPNATYSERELLPSNYKEPIYKVKKIIGVKTVRGKKQYLVWWQGYKKEESTYEPEKELVNDGLKDMIDEYNKSLKK